MNVEPNPEHLAELLSRRPEDANLGVGISDIAATLTFFKFEKRASGLSTFDPDTAARHKKSGYTYEELTIPVVTLTEALGRVEAMKGAFDFLNVDVEGFERKVLAGLDFAKYPPKVIVLEATAPMTEEPTQQKWEDLLFANGYSFALDDGLNRYYVQRSQRPLQARFLEVGYCVSRDKLSKGIKLGRLPARTRQVAPSTGRKRRLPFRQPRQRRGGPRGGAAVGAHARGRRQCLAAGRQLGPRGVVPQRRASAALHSEGVETPAMPPATTNGVRLFGIATVSAGMPSAIASMATVE